MARAFNTYVVPATGMHVQLTALSTVKTATRPAEAVGCYLSAKAQSVRVTFDGSTPAATNGLVIIGGAQPVFFPLGDGVTLKALEEAASGELNVMWVN